MSAAAGEAFPEIAFRGQLRPSQAQIVAIARDKLASGRRRLHIVAPPGSGKTITGLYLWAREIRCPALVLSPNSAIQSQWAARTALFRRGATELTASVSTSPDAPALFTSLTYQSITLPARASESIDARAIDLWIQTLLEQEQAESGTAAEIWVRDLSDHNPDYYQQRLAHYRKKVRDDDAANGRAMQMLHDSCLATLERIRSAKVGLLILDECHHLMGHWGRVLSEIRDYLGDPIVLGLTATPPDRADRDRDDVERYDDFFGEIDYSVPVPAVVKDGFLAPYQDLAYFVRPTQQELAFVARADEGFQSLISRLLDRCEQRENLLQWLQRVLRDKQLGTYKAKDWRRFRTRDPEFADAAVHFLDRRGVPLPDGVPALPAADEAEETASLTTLIDRYTRHHLRRSSDPVDHQLAELAIQRLRMLGVQITETGHRPCASPVSRVIAYSRNKSQALIPILTREWETLGNSVRAVVIADYEKTSAVTSEVSHLLDEEVGGAVAAFRTLLDHETTNQLAPVLVTGSTVLVDADLVDRFFIESKRWLQRHSSEVELSDHPQGNFHLIRGRGAAWCPRLYVEMITELFQQGVTRCLVGTRGLLGEGWDANRINVLVDLSTATTSMTVNQLRGRSIRLDPADPNKLANNWDVVCIAPEFRKGLDDYRRFRRKHASVFGVCDDGAIEKGVGHVHAAFTEWKPELVEQSVSALNADMLRRAGHRAHAHQLWGIGKPYSGEPISALEVAGRAGGGGFPPFKSRREPWSTKSFAMAVGEAVLATLSETEMLERRPPLHAVQREGGYVRVFLQTAVEEDSRRFAAAVSQAMAPFENPRYVIPRAIDQVSAVFFAKYLPDALRRFFERRDRQVVMLHAVPDLFASHRKLVDVYQRHWNEHVSPGEAVYAKNTKGQQLIDEAIQAGWLPNSIVHHKEVFL